MSKVWKFSLIFIFLLNLSPLSAQKSGLNQDPESQYRTAVDLFQKEKFIKYRLIWGKSNDPHSYFPGICKQEEDTVHQWISDQKDSDGFRHKLIFRSCSEIEVQYRNPKKKNRKEGFKVMERLMEFTLNYLDKELMSRISISILSIHCR